MVTIARRCSACTARPPPFAAARAALAYNAAARTLILPFKYANRPELARLLASMMVRAGAPLLQAADCLVPVPLHRARLRRRGYNQAALLAARLSRLSGMLCLPAALHRPVHTPELEGADAAARHRIMRTAVAVRPSYEARVAGRTILLIDDVMTSGATASACTRALLAEGAASVSVLIAARVP